MFKRKKKEDGEHEEPVPEVEKSTRVAKPKHEPVTTPKTASCPVCGCMVAPSLKACPVDGHTYESNQ